MTKLQLADLESAFRRQAARELMLAGVTVVDPARLDVRGTVTHGADVFIDVNVVLEGNVKLGDRVRIHPNCVIRNSEIGDDTEVFPNVVIDSTVIGASCNIGPFARFRPTSTLSNGVHIGNFVEVKNSNMGEGSKANHLAYVGDAEVGSRVNIGAGTIIANYDGANKHRTNHRGRRSYGIQQCARRADQRRRRCDDRRRFHRRARGSRRQAHGRSCASNHDRRLAEADQTRPK